MVHVGLCPNIVSRENASQWLRVELSFDGRGVGGADCTAINRTNLSLKGSEFSPSEQNQFHYTAPPS